MFSPYSVTEKKQSGNSLSQSEIEFMVNGYTAGTISDDEMSPWLKAVFDHGMKHEETLHYTQSMLHSGVTLDFSHLNGYVIDKHSTGGIGDKISIILGPLLAACGCYIPMLAGRGLGHTQGTIDKLETIPGYHPSLSLPKFQQIVKDVGISIMAQTEEICPADLKIYALRDLTNTVASFPLICGSIMSKKIAEGIQGLVLDIKVGNGAFMKTLSEAKALGGLLKDIGQFYDIHVSICYTGMEQPLGNMAGLWCEVMESIKCLKGNGPEDVMTIVYNLGEAALCHAGESNPVERLMSAIEDGSALEKFEQMVSAHGGSIKSLDNLETNKPLYHSEIRADNDGYISSMDTFSLGLAVVHLGGGRGHKGATLDPTVGIVFHKKTGDLVNRDEPLLEYFCSDKNKLESSKLYFKKAIEIKSEPPKPIELIYR